MSRPARASLALPGAGEARYWPLTAAATSERLAVLPIAIRILLESAIRHGEDVAPLADWRPDGERGAFCFRPGRVLLQDFTGVPAVVDLAALRDSLAEAGGDPALVNPAVPVDLVVDHSVQVDHSGRSPDAAALNLEIEYRRNAERYAFLKWGQSAFANFRVVPPGRGIVHQVNLEWLATVVAREETPDGPVLFPDTLVGTDSHTTMVNGLGVLGWGVGGIEAEAVMLGQPLPMVVPDVVGFRLVGRLGPGVTATDLVLRVTEMLRERGVVGNFVEFFGPGLDALALADRATIANMAPEYGATCGLFPVDAATLDYLKLTGRPTAHIEMVAAYTQAQGLFRGREAPECAYTATLHLDLASVETSLAGPKRPQDRVALRAMKTHWRASLRAPLGHHGHGLDEAALGAVQTVTAEDGSRHELTHGAVAIAAITSCTNTSNPGVMVAAGLLAKRARSLGMEPRPWVKTSLAPGSRVVTDYLERAGLLDDLAALGFGLVGYGCTTCIGNSGPVPEHFEQAARDGIILAAVLSGNRNFEGRIHAAIQANYLASPPLVVAYALAGTMDIDLATEPLGKGRDGRPVHLADLWPSDEEVRETVAAALGSEMFLDRYADTTREPRWDAIAAPRGERFPWDPESTYILRPSFLRQVPTEPPPIKPVMGARALLLLGDTVTTDHISPAGAIPPTGPAGRWLRQHGVGLLDFNSFGSRRGNHEVMARGTFANLRLRNLLAPGTEGGFTTHFPSGAVMTVWEAAQRYREEDVPLIVLAGGQYGTGSSRDWAAKGTLLLGVRVVVAKSYERIHRSNLIGMGVLPLLFPAGEDDASLGLSGSETFALPTLSAALGPGSEVPVVVTSARGEISFSALAAVETEYEADIWRQGGILPAVQRMLMAG